jgi:ArsR family transcriptional regulator
MAHDHGRLLFEVKERMPEDGFIEQLAALYHAFGNQTRMKILFALYRSPLCVYELAELVGMEQSAVSHQLNYLKKMNLIRSEREGKTLIYSLADSHVEHIIAIGSEHLTEEEKD